MIKLKIDPRQLQQLANLIGAAGREAPHAVRRATNHTGQKVRTRMIRVLYTRPA